MWQNGDMECVLCGKQLEPEWKVCPNCGKAVDRSNDEWKLSTRIAVIVCGLVLAAILIWVLAGGDLSAPDVTPAAESHEITYKIYGSAPFAIVGFSNAQGGHTDNQESLPWKDTEQIQSGEIVALSATVSSGSAILEIDIDGKEWKKTAPGNSFMSAQDECP